jgi:hypothetical protein
LSDAKDHQAGDIRYRVCQLSSGNRIWLQFVFIFNDSRRSELSTAKPKSVDFLW